MHTKQLNNYVYTIKKTISVKKFTMIELFCVVNLSIYCLIIFLTKKKHYLF